MINLYELKKIYIAELGIDPHLQMEMRSKHKVKNAMKLINKLQINYPDAYEAESALVREIETLIDNPRQREYAGLLLSLGFEENVLSGKAYDSIRNKMGVTEYDDATKSRVEEKWMREYQEDPFSLLSGPQINVNINTETP